jgi:hypothetical protein
MLLRLSRLVQGQKAVQLTQLLQPTEKQQQLWTLLLLLLR